jgi:hypothetical protein
MKRKSSWLSRYAPFVLTLVITLLMGGIMIHHILEFMGPTTPKPPPYWFWPPMAPVPLTVVMGMAALILALVMLLEKKRRRKR